MPTKEVLMIDGYSQDLLVSVEDRTITIQNTETDATHFCFSVGAADWEVINKFIVERLKSE